MKHIILIICILVNGVSSLWISTCYANNKSVPQLDIRHIFNNWDIDNDALTDRIVKMSNEDFLKEWRWRCDMSSDVFAIGDYLLFSSFMAHEYGENSYIMYNPKSNKLSVAYREYDSSIGKFIIHIASEEDQYPIDIHNAGFEESLSNTADSITYSCELHLGAIKNDVDPVERYICNKQYEEAIENWGSIIDRSGFWASFIFDTISRNRFYDFRDYVFRESCDTTLLLNCADYSYWFYLCFGANIAHVIDAKDAVSSLKYAIQVYEFLNTTSRYDTLLAHYFSSLSALQMEYEWCLDAHTREDIKTNLEHAYFYFRKINDAKETISILLTTGDEYFKEHDFYRAEQIYKSAQSRTEEMYGHASYEYADVLNRLRNFYYYIENYPQARLYTEQYIETINDIGGDGISSFHSWRTSTIHSTKQADTEWSLFQKCHVRRVRYGRIGQIEDYYSKEGLWKKVLQICLECEKDSLYKCNNLLMADAYRGLNNNEKEELYLTYWLEDKRNQYGDESEEFAKACLKLCAFYQRVGDKDKAYESATKAISIEIKSSEHLYIREILRGCGEYALWAKQYKNAELCYKTIIEHYSKKYGLGYLNVDKSKDLEPLVDVYLKWGKYNDAVKIEEEIMELGQQPDGKLILNYKFLGDFEEKIGNDTLALMFYNKGGLNGEVERLLYKHKDFESAKQFIRYHFDSIKVDINKKILVERESEREKVWQKNNQYLSQTLPKYCYEAYLNSYDYSPLAYDVSLFTKGYLLSTSKVIQRAILESKEDELIASWRELLVLQDRISQPLANDSVPILQERARYIEQQILTFNREMISASEGQTISWNDVRRMLKKKELAIEIFEVPLSSDSTVYCALLLRKDSQTPTMIPLFNEQEVASLINTTTENQTSFTYAYDGNGEQLSKLVWSKILPYIKKGETVYFAPSGLLHQLAIESLPYDENHTMADRFNLVRLSSTREIVTRKDELQHTSAALYGGIQYDVDTDGLLAESKKYSATDLLASRGIEEDTLDRGSIKYLKGSKTEVENINQMLKQNNLQVQLFTSTNANEESFKALSGKHQNILHIATHGFFWTDSTAYQKDYFSQRMMTLGGDMPVPQTIDPLNRCGLLFAGAQTAWSGHSSDLPEGVQDGILTAKEISLLDLRDADLVVLSACETGKGEITGEGVFGLQRAFKQAGAQTIIMSLWPVNDAATQLLMTEFYRNWITNHQSKREAFREAQNTIRSKYTEPVYWAGFIMLD